MAQPDAKLSVVLWTIGGGFAFAIVGALFGAIVGGVTRRDNRIGGSWIGMRLADAVLELLEREPSPVRRSVIVGAADGAFFLGTVGLLIGLVAHYSGAEASEWLVSAFVTLVCLIGGALALGVLAHGILRARIDSIFAISVGGLSGAALTAYYFHAGHVVPGTLTGVVLGFLCHVVLARSKRT